MATNFFLFSTSSPVNDVLNRNSINSNLSQLIFFVYFYENVCNLDNNRLICGNWFPINVQRTLFQIYLFIEFVLKILLICFRKTGDSTANYRPTCWGIKNKKVWSDFLRKKFFGKLRQLSETEIPNGLSLIIQFENFNL